MANHTLSWVDWANRRPLLDTPLQILQQVFGLNLHAFYLVAWLVTTLAAVQLFVLIRQVRPDWRLRAWGVAAVALVYPADFSQMWLAHVLHARIGWLLALVAASCLVLFLKRRAIGWLIAATLLSSIALLLYEAQLGVFVAFGLLLLVVYRQVPWRTRWLLFIPLGVNGAYTLWRSVGLRVAGIQDQYLGELTLGVGDLLGRVLLGIQVLWWSWTEPVRRLLHLDSNGLALLIMLGALIILVFGAMRAAARQPAITTETSAASTKTDWLTLLIGAGLSVAGYFPTILLYEPNLDGVYSRVNFYALPGAALCLLAAVSMLIGRLAHGDLRRWRAGFMTVVVALIGLGMLVQIWVRHNAVLAWQEQRALWAQLFNLAPRFEPETMVVFVLPDSHEQIGFANWWRTPLSAGWEASAALRVLYADPTLQGAVIMPEVVGYGEPNLVPTGVKDPWTGNIVSYDRAVFLTYDRSRQQLTVLQDAAPALNVDWPLTGYEPNRRIALDAPPAVPLRRLVQDSSGP